MVKSDAIKISPSCTNLQTIESKILFFVDSSFTTFPVDFPIIGTNPVDVEYVLINCCNSLTCSILL